MAPRHAMIALVIRYAPTCYKRWAVAHTYFHRCRTPARILHAPGHAQTMRLCCFSVWWPLRQRQGGDAEAGWPIPAGPESAQPPATIPQACLLADGGVHFLSLFTRGRGAELRPFAPSPNPPSSRHGQRRPTRDLQTETTARGCCHGKWKQPQRPWSPIGGRGGRPSP